VHPYTSVRAQVQNSWDFKSLSLRGADVGSGHSLGGGLSQAHDNPADTGHPSTHPPLIPPLILHTIPLQYFQGMEMWESHNSIRTILCRGLCWKCWALSLCACFDSCDRFLTFCYISESFIIFLRCLRWTYTMLLFEERVLSYSTVISKGRIRLFVSPFESVSKLSAILLERQPKQYNIYNSAI
jgi:hypothetical protein